MILLDYSAAGSETRVTAYNKLCLRQAQWVRLAMLMYVLLIWAESMSSNS